MHIPKCAGSTIRNGLKPFDSYRLEGGFDYPDGGRRNLHHIPLADLRIYFPEMFEKVLRYESYAIVREPRERFASALLQFLRTRKGVNLSRQSLAAFQQAAHGICAEIEKAGDKPVFDAMLFQPQSRFVMLDGQRIVRNLYRFDELPRFAADLKARHGVVLDISVPYNQAQLKNGALLQRAKDLLRPLVQRRLSPDQLRWLRSKARRVTGNSPARLYAELFTDSGIGAFVDRFYVDDFTLYRSMRPANSSSGAPEPREHGSH